MARPTPAKLKEQMGKVLNVEIEKLADEAILQELVADSFVLIDMVISLQSTFAIRLDQEDLADVHTVGDLIRVMLTK